jgi:hypothetical protein
MKKILASRGSGVGLSSDSRLNWFVSHLSSVISVGVPIAVAIGWYLVSTKSAEVPDQHSKPVSDASFSSGIITQGLSFVNDLATSIPAPLTFPVAAAASEGVSTLFSEHDLFHEVLMEKYDEAEDVRAVIEDFAVEKGVPVEDVIALFRQNGEPDSVVLNKMSRLCFAAYDEEVFSLNYDFASVMLGNSAIALTQFSVPESTLRIAERFEPGRFGVYTMNLPEGVGHINVFAAKEDVMSVLSCTEEGIQDALTELEKDDFNTMITLGKLSGISDADASLYAAFRLKRTYPDYALDVTRIANTSSSKYLLRAFLNDIAKKSKISISYKGEEVPLFNVERNLNNKFILLYLGASEGFRQRFRTSMKPVLEANYPLAIQSVFYDLLDGIELLYATNLRPPQTLGEHHELSRFCFPECTDFPAHEVAVRALEYLISPPMA